MAQRPIFVPITEGKSFVKTVDIDFKWYPGYSIQQKQKSITSLHENAREKQINSVLEISTKSTETIGVSLSAFNLLIRLNDGNKISVEAAYQGSKKFEHGGPYTDFFNLEGSKIKKDKRLHNSGKLVSFAFDGDEWSLEPKDGFYNWLYIKALSQNEDISKTLTMYDGFSDIEFNPKKSFSCQAKAAALFVSLTKRGLLDKAIKNPDTLKKVVSNHSILTFDAFK